MNSEEYMRRLEDVFQGEVQSEAMFGALAGALPDIERRYKMRVLERLELETKELVRHKVSELKGDSAGSVQARETGIAQAKVLAAMPWEKFMHIFRREVAKFVTGFEELERLGPAADAAFLSAVTAHERALQTFSERECAGSPTDSLEPVIARLKVVPTRGDRDSSSR